MNYEQKNALLAGVFGVLGFMVMIFGGALFFFLRESWQMVIAIVGILLMGLGAFADN